MGIANKYLVSSNVAAIPVNTFQSAVNPNHTSFQADTNTININATVPTSYPQTTSSNIMTAV